MIKIDVKQYVLGVSKKDRRYGWIKKMNLRALIYMNPLVVDKISKKFLYEKDSGFLYTKQLIESFPNDWRVTILVPNGFNPDFFPGADCIEYDYSTSIHQNRYHFNRNILAKLLPYSKDIDVVFNMQPEVSQNIKVFFQNQRRESPIIVNYFHWIDCWESSKYAKELSGYIWRQVESARTADMNLFHTEHALKQFLDYAVDNELPVKRIMTSYFRPKPTKFGMEEYSMRCLVGNKIIMFNHRLNNSTGWKKILSICAELYREGRHDFILWFTDESNLKEKGYLESFPFVKVESVPFKNYGYVLSKAHFSICNIKGYATWNMAVLDSINYGTPVIAPEMELWKELGCYVTDDMKGSIIKMLDSDKWTPMDVELGAFDIVKFVENTIRERVAEKNPVKYDDVVEMISTKEGGVTKKDWVNEFWSFHANSNFQIIRWKLLSQEGIKDNIDEEYTSYYV